MPPAQTGTCAVRKDHSDGATTCLKITGEYEGKVSDSITLFFMCFNPQHELIGVLLNEQIYGLSGKATYSYNLYLPRWEIVDRIVVKPIPNPISARYGW